MVNHSRRERHAELEDSRPDSRSLECALRAIAQGKVDRSAAAWTHQPRVGTPLDDLNAVSSLLEQERRIQPDGPRSYDGD
jgi:hypothetical protein